ncbi:MAG: SDR family oxidoreductase [Saprospiraceae bacterium]
MEIDLVGKKALVCGASRGIGKAVAIALAESGATVTLLARNAELLESTVKALPQKFSQKHNFFTVDMSNLQNVQNFVDNELKLNNIHILINNAGGPAAGKLYEATTTSLESAFQQHLLCNHLLMQSLIRGMKEESYGRIINIISTSVKQPLENLGVSNSIRAAVASWAKTLANELAIWNITVNNVLPGATETDRLREIITRESQLKQKTEEEVRNNMLSQIPLKRFGQASELANAVAFLASPLASYINGINLPVDGGRTKSL